MQGSDALYGSVAQLVERLFCKQDVMGSIPFRASSLTKDEIMDNWIPVKQAKLKVGYYLLRIIHVNNELIGELNTDNDRLRALLEIETDWKPIEEVDLVQGKRYWLFGKPESGDSYVRDDGWMGHRWADIDEIPSDDFTITHVAEFEYPEPPKPKE